MTKETTIQKILMDKINEAFVAFKIGKITELEKDIYIRGIISQALQAQKEFMHLLFSKKYDTIR